MAALFLTLIITIFIVWVVVRIIREIAGATPAASARGMCSSTTSGTPPDGTASPVPAALAPRNGPARPAAAVAAASAAAAAAVGLEAAASAAADTAPAPAAVPVPAPAPVPVADGRAARPKISTARCGWTRRFPKNWIPETGGTAARRLSFSQKRGRPASRAAQAGGILESFLYYHTARLSPCK